MKRWQHIVIQMIATWTMVMIAWPILSENLELTLLFGLASVVHSLSNYFEGKNTALGLYDNTHKKKGSM